MTDGRVIAAAAALLLPLAACGKKAPPLAPLHSIPGPVSELAARRVGPEMRIRFTLPIQNVGGTERIDLERVEIYAVTVEPGGVVPPGREFMTRKYLVKSIAVRPPPVDEEAPVEEEPEAAGTVKPKEEKAIEKQAQKPAVKDDRPLPGDRVTFLETLTEAELRPAITAKPPAMQKGAPAAPPAVIDPPVVTRYYIVRGRSRRGDAGAPSTRIALPLVPEPPPPDAVRASVTEKALALEWTAPPAAIDPVAAAVNERAWDAVKAPLPPLQAAVSPPRQPAPPPASSEPPALVPLTRLPGVQLPPTEILPVAARFNVYAVKGGKAEDASLNASPLTAPTFAVGEPVWNEETCFLVRAVRVYGLVSVESQSSEPTCVTPADTFPPAAPAGLKAVAAAGAMNLIWDANSEPDLGGYLVLRGEAPGATLQALTSAPIPETNYRDTTVNPGVRYVYAIVAVDKASPPNMSAQSARVEETAR